MLKKRLNSFRFAFAGIKDLIQSQPNAQIHLLFTVVVIGLALLLDLVVLEWILLIFCITIVFSAEAMNTALEYLTDLVSPEYHPLAGKAKDAAAAAVLITAIGAALIGGMILVPKLWKYFF